jgi:ubiquinone/menaquinone biosynthesis C-methylase UbiE
VSGPIATPPTGNLYDKYGTANPVERWLVGAFFDRLDQLLPAATPARILEVGTGEGEVARRVTARYPGVPVVALDLPDHELGANVFGDAHRLPFPDGAFDLVLGHAVLHHLPELDAAFAEFRRVLRPGGVIAFCGEPSQYGDRLAAVPKRGALAVAPLWRALVGAGRRAASNGAGPSEEERLEQVVDVHAFAPGDLARPARAAGFERVRVRGEELVAGLFGWANRTLESTARPDDVPWAWRLYAYRGYLALQTLDRSLLEPRLPAGLFYNLLVSGRTPAP